MEHYYNLLVKIYNFPTELYYIPKYFIIIILCLCNGQPLDIVICAKLDILLLG